MWADTTETLDLSTGSYSNPVITWNLGTAITVQQMKGTSSTAVNESYVSAPRVYKGHILSFTASAGYKIKSISITVNGSYYGNSMTAGTSLSGNTVTDNTSAVSRSWTNSSGGTHKVSSVSDEGLSQIYIQNVASANNVQLRISSISITYTTVATYTLSSAVIPASTGTVTLDKTTLAAGGTTTITATPNDGYRFTNWSVSGTGASVTSTTTNPTTFTMGTTDATVTANFEAIPTHTLTVTATSAGTITVKNGEDEVASGSSVREGTELTITAVAGVGKKFNSWSLTGATPASSTSTETTFTVGENDVTVAANFDDVTTYPVHWSVNGVVATDNVAEGDPIIFKAPESGIPAGYKFTGWVAAANRIDGTTTTEPTANYVKSANATAEVTYYAVLVDTKTPDELTSALTGVTGTSYTGWSGKTSISGAVYAGQCAGQNSTIQLRSKNSESGVITTTSGGKAKKVVIEWNDATSETRTLTIYGKNSAYTAATELYSSSTAGTSLGELNVDDAVNQKSVLNITGDYEYIGIRSKDGALYLDKISIYWNEVENYCTTVPTATINIAAACTDGDKRYGTYSNSKAFIVPADLTVYEVSVIGGEMLLEAYATDDIVPANTGVLVAGDAGDHDVMLTTGGTSKLGSDNMLRATGTGIDAAAMSAADASCKFYRLTMHEGTQIGFFWGAAEGAAFAVAANKAYLAVPNTEAGAVKGFRFGENTDAIIEIMRNGENEKMSAIYDLSGRRVMKPTKGLYIMNGKKVVK